MSDIETTAAEQESKNVEGNGVGTETTEQIGTAESGKSEAAEPTQTVDDGASAPEDGEAAARFAPITTQEDFDKAISHRLSREKKKTETEKKRADDLEKELNGLKEANQIREWKEEVSSETGVPVKLLRGSTKDELKSHAEDIAASYKPASAPVVPSDGRGKVANGMTKDQIMQIEDMDERHAAIAANIELFN